MKKRLFLGIFAAFLFLMPLTACGGSSSSGNGNNGNNVVQNEIVLSSDEQTVYNAVKNSLSAFKNPGSVTVISVSTEVLIGGRYLKISAQNGFGGTTVSMYQVSGSSLRGPIDDYSSYKADSSISVSNINKKLNEYKVSMGWK